MIKYALKDLIEVGTFYKSSGVKGEIIGDLHEELLDKFKSITYIFINHKGQSLPYFIEKIRIDNGSIKFKLEGIDNPESATELANQNIYLDQNKLTTLKVKLASSSHDVVGLLLYNDDQLIGTIAELLEYPGHNVLTIVEDSDLVIPFVEDWVLDINKESVIMSFDKEILKLNK